MKKFLKRFYKSKFFGIICAMSFSLLAIGTAMIVVGTTPVRAEELQYGNYVEVEFLDDICSDGGITLVSSLSIHTHSFYEYNYDGQDFSSIDQIMGFGSWNYLLLNGTVTDQQIDDLRNYAKSYNGLTLTCWSDLWDASGNYNPYDKEKYKKAPYHLEYYNFNGINYIPTQQEYGGYLYDNGPMSVFPTWQGKRKVTFDAEGGTFYVKDKYSTNSYGHHSFGGDSAGWYFFNTTINESGYYENNQGVACPHVSNPTRVGFVFTGWYNQDGIQYYDAKGALVYEKADDDVDTNNEIYLTAGWVKAWSGFSKVPDGLGSYNDPYIIDEATDLAYIFDQSYFNQKDFAGKYFLQTADIDLEERIWLSIGMETSFKGTYDGGNFKIKNLTTGTHLGNNCSGFIAQNEGVIKNVIIIDASVNAKENSGAIAGYVTGGKLEGCKVINSEISAYRQDDEAGTMIAGGLVGYIKPQDSATSIIISNCSVENTSVSTWCDVNPTIAGGLIGSVSKNNAAQNQVQILNCKVVNDSILESGRSKHQITVSSPRYQLNSAGGLCGLVDGAFIESCLVENIYINAYPMYARIGFIGNALNASIHNCTFNQQQLNSQQTAAGEIEACAKLQDGIFGFVGSASNIIIESCTSLGVYCEFSPDNENITTLEYGSIAGDVYELSVNGFTAIDCGVHSASSGYAQLIAGGMLGFGMGDISINGCMINSITVDDFFEWNKENWVAVGGLIGFNASVELTIEECMVTSVVMELSDTYAGGSAGLIGEADSNNITIKKCYVDVSVFTDTGRDSFLIDECVADKVIVSDLYVCNLTPSYESMSLFGSADIDIEFQNLIVKTDNRTEIYYTYDLLTGTGGNFKDWALTPSGPIQKQFLHIGQHLEQCTVDKMIASIEDGGLGFIDYGKWL